MEMIEVPRENGDYFLIEVDRRRERVGRGTEAIETAQESFQRSLVRVRGIADDVVDSLSSMMRRPEKVRVEFGVKLTGEAGIIVSRVGGEAHFLLSLEWSNAPDGLDA